MSATPYRRFLTPTLLAVPTLLASPLTASAENPGAHQHGYAELQLAFSGQTVELRALSPAYNLLGFEHEPRTEAQHQTLETTLHWLEDTPLINVAGANCVLENSEVVYAHARDDHKDLEHDGHSDHSFHHDHDDHSNHDDQGHKEQDHAEHGEESHSDIEVFQTLNCPGLDSDARLVSQFSERFPALEHMNIQWSGPGGQGALRLAPGESRFRLTH